ncbi:MAG: hypothetical protein AAGE52_23105 [Myxococcota bacterium]
MRDCAEIMSKDGELKAQHGEPAYKPLFQQYLAQRGIDENTWAHAWNGWWTRMESDPSGQLHAKFAMLQQELTMQAHFADVPDASQDAKEGVTLEMYAKIMAGIAGGKDAQAEIAANGLTWDQWQRAQAAWNQAMAEDVNHHLTTQYGQLYAKFTPGFQQQMQGQVAGIMAAEHARRENASMEDDEPDEDYTFEMAMQELSSPKPAVRWTAAHHVANFWDIGDRASDPRLDQAAKQAIDVMMECLERHDEFTVSDAESLAGDLFMFAAEGFLGDRADDVKHMMELCLGRAQDELAKRKAAFAPIANKAVPERVKLQSAIQDYTSLVDELTEKIAEWDDNLGEPQAAVASGGSAPSMGGAPASSGAIQPSGGGGFLDMLKSLPIIGNILRALGL